MKFLPLTQGYYAIVDNEEYERLSQWKWRIQRNGNNIYVVRTIYLPDGKQRVRTLHREVLGLHHPTPGKVVDHADGNTLDNRRGNLRLCTHSQNSINQPTRKGKKSSKYKGVFYKPDGRLFKACWKASIKCKGKVHNLGNFYDEFSAVKAYNSAAYRLFGKFAYLNHWDGPTNKQEDDSPENPIRTPPPTGETTATSPQH